MSALVERFPDRPRGCTCDEATFDRWPDRRACSARAGFEVHPVFEADDLAVTVGTFRAGALAVAVDDAHR